MILNFAHLYFLVAPAYWLLGKANRRDKEHLNHVLWEPVSIEPSYIATERVSSKVKLGQVAQRLSPLLNEAYKELLCFC